MSSQEKRGREVSEEWKRAGERMKTKKKKMKKQRKGKKIKIKKREGKRRNTGETG